MIARPIARLIAREIASVVSADVYGTVFNPEDLFAANEPGYVYDNDDLTTLFQDTAGSVPAVANQLVGLQFDKSKGMALGSDARSAGAPALLGSATAATWNAGTGVGSVSYVDGSNQSYIAMTGLTANAWYKFVVSAVSGTVFLRSGAVGGALFVSITAPGTYYCPANSSGAISITRNASAGTSTFTFTAINSFAGAHRYQGTTASKPMLRGTPTGGNLFTAYGTPEAGWVNSGGGVATATATTGNMPTTFAPTIGRVYRVRWTATVTSGSVRLIGGGYNGSARTASGTYEEYFTASTTTALTFDAVSSFTGTVSAVNIHDVSVDVVTAPYALQYDGVDDFMVTTATNFTSTDAVTLCMGVRKLSDAAAAAFVELSASTAANNGAFAIFAPASAAANLNFTERGTVQAAAVYSNAAVASPVTLVATGIGDISSDTCLLRVNGTQVATAVIDQGTSNLGNHILYFGRRGGTTNPFNGLDYGGICLGRTAVVIELVNIEQYVAQRTGVTI